jgi:endonuclease YncB( thermonuclease family)
MKLSFPTSSIAIPDSGGVRLSDGIRLVVVVVFLSALVWALTPDHSGEVAPEMQLLDRGEVTVMDGDTILIRGKEVRLVGMDAPEDASPNFEGDQEPYATRAKDYLKGLLDQADVVGFTPLPERGLYNRRLGHLFVDGKSVSAEMVRAGHAYENISFYGYQNFPEVGEEILSAASEAVPPLFEEPYFFWKSAKGL